MEFKQLDRDILGDLWESSDLWDNLTYLCDACNGRFAGTPDERRAGDFILSRFQKYGLANVAAESFEMRGWQRGEAHLTLLSGDSSIELPCIALPGSQPCSLEAEIIDLGPGAPADFQRLGSAVAGRIVLTSSEGPSRQEKYLSACDAGAAGFIFGGDQSGLLAPTGSISRDLPGIGLAVESAARVRRALQAGALRASLTIAARVQTVTARNIVGEIPGTQPEEGWILAGGHYDGHDISQAAQDNGAGTAVLMEAARLLSPLREHLRIGIRFISFSGEELGLFGSYAYVRDHASQLDPVRVMFNADVVGLALPLVLQTQGSQALANYFRSLPLADLDAVVNDGQRSFIPNSDHFPFSLAGISTVMAVTSRPEHRAHWVHTAADTLDKLEPRTVRGTAAAVARLLLRMSSDPQNLPRAHMPPQEVQRLVTEAGFEKSLRAGGHWPF
jgi:aminopeptidase YwaD